MKQKVISFGPCQTPVLNFCVEQHFKVTSFKPQQYWTLNPQVDVGYGKTNSLDWGEEVMFCKATAEKTRQEMEKTSQAYVSNKDVRQVQKLKPEGLNTVEMLKQASCNLGFSPMAAMDTAEKLYLNGYITYPR